MPTIRVRDFAQSPGGRFADQGPSSGEDFRETVLVPALRGAIASGEALIVELDGTSGYGSSFLEEAFGGLVREGVFSPAQINDHLRVIAREPLYAPYASLAMRYIASAEKNLIAA